ncbi:MAG: hypothetical protein IT366_23975 [Candidatus Hydrogenedentes bacterium]|nr:hypothetical protein [Candidatus Hydrogenedentota bacterium]
MALLLLLSCTPQQPSQQFAEQPAPTPQPAISPDVIGIASHDFPEPPTEDKLTHYTYVWDRIQRSWNGHSGQEISNACMTVYKAKSFYPELTMLYVLDSLAAQIPKSSTGEDLPSRMHIAQAADDIYLALEDAYYAPIEAAQAAQAEADAALQETIAANQAAARERGGQHNLGMAERQRAANAQQAELQQRAIAAGEEARQKQIASGLLGGPGVASPPMARQGSRPYASSQPYVSTSTSIQRTYSPTPSAPQTFTQPSTRAVTRTNAQPQTTTGGATVWIAPYSGKKYHRTSGCRGLSNARSTQSLSLSEAMSQGYTACQICY